MHCIECQEFGLCPRECNCWCHLGMDLSDICEACDMPAGTCDHAGGPVTLTVVWKTA